MTIPFEVTGRARYPRLIATTGRIAKVFPVSVSGNFILRPGGAYGSSAEDVARRIESMLREARASSVSRQGVSVRFTARPIRLVSNWNILVPFGYGEISVSDTRAGREIDYRASFVQTLVLTSVLIVFFCFLLARKNLNSGQTLTLEDFYFLPVVWCFLVGANYVVAMFRFPAWLKRGILDHDQDEVPGEPVPGGSDVR